MIYEYNRYNFLCNLIKSGHLLRVREIDMPDYIDYESIQRKYGIIFGDSINKIRFKFWNHLHLTIDQQN